MNKLLISQDLDETLFYTSTRPLKDREPDLVFEKYYVYFRPGVKEYLSKITESPRFELGVYTAATRDYAEYILERILPSGADLLFLFDRERMVKQDVQSFMPYSHFAQANLFKDLKKVKRATGYDYDRIIAVDDRPQLYPRQYSNVISVPEYKGTLNDRVLDYAWRFLNVLSKDESVRPREKRGWLSKFENNNTNQSLGI